MGGMRGNYFFLWGIMAAVGLAGCSQTAGVSPAATPATSANVNTASDTAKPPRVITKGMDGDEIVRRIGKPSEIRPMETPEGHAEIWVYRRNAGVESTLTATGVTQTPVADPLTGARFFVPEPSYSQERKEMLETTNLLMFEGKLLEWTRMVEGKRTFN